MKEVVKERLEKYTVWQAVDGTEFVSEEECQHYDTSALGVLRGKLKPLIVNDEYNGWDLMGGCEDHTILAIKVPTEEAKSVVLQNYYLDNPWVLNTNNTVRKEKLVNAVEKAFKEQDIILFGLNCDDELYLIDTRNTIINRLNKLDKKESQNG